MPANSSLPRRVVVGQVIQGRYEPGKRPVSWDERAPGIEKVELDSGEQIALSSTGGQSTPAPGWELFLTEDSEDGFLWTLYGIGKKAA